MSWQSTTWATTLKPERLQGVSPAAHITLCLLANRADERGRGVFYAIPTLAKMRGLSERTIQRHINELAAAGLIRMGDQRLVQHIPHNRRPVVWNLCHKPIGELESDPNLGVTRMSPQESEPVDNTAPRGDKNVTPGGSWGDTKPALGVTSGVTQDVSNTSIEITTNSPTEGEPELSTGPEITATSRPDRLCVHQFDAVFVTNRKDGKTFPACPFCRRTPNPDIIVLAPLEPAHA